MLKNHWLEVSENKMCRPQKVLKNLQKLQHVDRLPLQVRQEPGRVSTHTFACHTLAQPATLTMVGVVSGSPFRYPSHYLCVFKRKCKLWNGRGIAQVLGVFNIQPSGATDKASQCPLIPPSNLLHTHPASLHILYHGYPKPGVIIFTTPFQIFSKEMCWHIYGQIL